MKIRNRILVICFCFLLNSCYSNIEELDSECILFSFGDVEYFDEVNDIDKPYLDFTKIKMSITNLAIEVSFELLELPYGLRASNSYTWAAEFDLDNSGGYGIVVFMRYSSDDHSSKEEISDILDESNKYIEKIASDGVISRIGTFSSAEIIDNSLVLNIERDEIGELSCIDLNTPVRFVAYQTGPSSYEDRYPKNGFITPESNNKN